MLATTYSCVNSKFFRFRHKISFWDNITQDCNSKECHLFGELMRDC